jgi:hypothetical protein
MSTFSDGKLPQDVGSASSDSKVPSRKARRAKQVPGNVAIETEEDARRQLSSSSPLTAGFERFMGRTHDLVRLRLRGLIPNTCSGRLVFVCMTSLLGNSAQM